MVSTRSSWVRSGWGFTGAAVLVVIALVVAATVVWRAVGPGRDYSVTPHVATERTASTTGAAEALANLVSAVSDRDVAAAASLAPPGDQPAQTMLTGVVANAGALDVVDFSARYIAQSSLDADGSWTGAVDLSWRFEGFDAHAVREEVQVHFESTSPSSDGGGAVAITGFGGTPDRSPLWLSGPVQVRRGGGTLVLATTAADADLLAHRARRAVTVVRRVLPTWSGGLVVEVPSSEEQLDSMLGAAADTYTSIAAVSASVDGTVTASSPVHVFVNPTVYDALDPIGGQVVLSHEATHIATNAPVTTGLPSWLLEGFADYVALRDVQLPLSTTAGQILTQVRDSGPPDHLPDSTDFDEHATNLGATYEAAWLVCRTLADVRGEPALVRFYEQLSAGKPLAAQLRQQFGLSEQQLLDRWQRRLRTLAATTTLPSSAPASTPPAA